MRTEFIGPTNNFLITDGGLVHDPAFKDHVRTEVTDYLGYDEDLDPAFFDTTPPPGYTVIDETTPAKP